MRDGKRTFKHLTKNDRLRIERWLRRGLKPREIADRLRVHISTVYRELGRGRYERLNGATWEMETAYSPDIAEAKYQAHLREKGPELKIGKDHELARYIEETILEKDCSPAAVLGYALIQGRKFRTSVSVATIYSYIKKGVFLHITQEELPRHGKKKQGYKKVKTKKNQARASAGESIENRPEEVVERKFGAVNFRKIFRSITVDNGSEFAAAEELERSAVNKTIPRTKVYFCHPYSSWERGSNENVNGMIRRKHHKGTDFSKVSAAEIARTEAWVNSYPRKILGYMSSEIMFRQCLRELGIAA